MTKIGDTVKWRIVSKDATGIVTEDHGGGDWLVTLESGKVVIVNEKSMYGKEEN